MLRAWGAFTGAEAQHQGRFEAANGGSLFAARMTGELGWREAPRFTAAAMARLSAHPWPGTIRELKNAVERAVYRAGEGKKIEEIIIDSCRRHRVENASAPARLASGRPNRSPTLDGERAEMPETVIAYSAMAFAGQVAATEITLLKETLVACHYNQRQTAARLGGLRYHQLRSLLRQYGTELGKV